MFGFVLVLIVLLIDISKAVLSAIYNWCKGLSFTTLIWYWTLDKVTNSEELYSLPKNVLFLSSSVAVIPKASIDEVEKLDKSKNYYIYCRSGNRSGQACQIMDKLGFENTYNLMGGFNEWDGDVTYQDE